MKVQWQMRTSTIPLITQFIANNHYILMPSLPYYPTTNNRLLHHNPQPAPLSLQIDSIALFFVIRLSWFICISFTLIYYCYSFQIMLRSSLGSQSQPSSYNYRDEISLLQRKDQQIKRLQNQLEQEKRRADSAVKMLESFKAIHQKYEEGGETLRSQINRRLKVEEELKKQQQRNSFLQEAIKRYVQMLKQSKQCERKEPFEASESREKL